MATYMFMGMLTAVVLAGTSPDHGALPSPSAPPLIDLAFERASTHEALLAVARAGGLDVVVGGDVWGRVRGRFARRPAREALDAIAHLAGARTVPVGGVLVVTTRASPVRPPTPTLGPAVSLHLTRAPVDRILEAIGTDVTLDHVLPAGIESTVSAHVTARPASEVLAGVATAAGLTLMRLPSGGWLLTVP